MTLYTSMLNADKYSWYTGKARFKATMPDSRMSATINLRMIRDSIIWATVDKLGLEVARMMITPDSVFIVDRLNREFTSESLRSFLNTYGVYVGFPDLQNLLIGRMIALNPNHVESHHEPDSDELIVRDALGVTAQHWISAAEPHRLVKSQFVDAYGRKLMVENKNWETMPDGSEFPLSRLVSFEDGDGITQIEITFSEVNIDVPASLPFSIPGHYAKAR